MNTQVVIGLIALMLAIGCGGVLVYYLMPRRHVDFRNLMATGPGTGQVAARARANAGRDLSEDELTKIKKETEKKIKKQRGVLTLDQKFFQAGMFNDKEKRDFYRLRILAPAICAPLIGFGIFLVAGEALGLVGLILGALVGMQIPNSILDRKILHRGEEIMYYLPLVIEQIAIGVSSSLDIGPCLQRVVSMADERDSHNVVTELIKHTQQYIKSGVSLEDAFTEVGKLSGHTELKHAFMSLAQVAKHGGEVTRQLQELADAVSAQRENRIDAKIKKLELAATGPVALVFFGFLIILLTGFGLQVLGAFK